MNRLLVRKHHLMKDVNLSEGEPADIQNISLG